jgi:hypothetical protein
MAASETVSLLLTWAVLGTVAALSCAQSSTTALRATILDPNEAAVPGVEVRCDFWACFLARS